MNRGFLSSFWQEFKEEAITAGGSKHFMAAIIRLAHSGRGVGGWQEDKDEAYYASDVVRFFLDLMQNNGKAEFAKA